MTGCCIPGCSNSTVKGFTMRSFPANSVRRTLWIKKIGIANWEPKKNSRICQVHFEKNMWEKVRCDGKKKLKCDAVPTLFPYSQCASDNQRNKNVSTENHNDENNKNINNDENDGNVNIDNVGNEEEIEDVEHELNRNSDKLSTLESEIHQNTLTDTREGTNWKEQCEELRNSMKKREELFCKIIKKNDRYRVILKNRLKRLKEENQSYKKLKTKLLKVFNEDQIQILSGRGTTWSDETLTRAFQLRFICGSKGYQEILNQNIPLPSQITLRRKLKTIDVDEIFSDMFKPLDNEETAKNQEDYMFAVDEIISDVQFERT